MQYDEKEFLMSFNNYIQSIAHHIINQCYGYVKCVYQCDKDMLLITIERKGFKFTYGVNDFTHKFCTITSQVIANEVIALYKKTITKWFIK